MPVALVSEDTSHVHTQASVWKGVMGLKCVLEFPPTLVHRVHSREEHLDNTLTKYNWEIERENSCKLELLCEDTAVLFIVVVVVVKYLLVKYNFSSIYIKSYIESLRLH